MLHAISMLFSHSDISDSLPPHGWWQHTRLPRPSPSPGAYSNSWPLGWWCHPTISSSVIPFSSHLQSFPASGAFQMSALRIRWPKYWSFSFNISPSNEYSGLISFRMDWLDLLAVQGTLKSLLQHHSSKWGKSSSGISEPWSWGEGAHCMPWAHWAGLQGLPGNPECRKTMGEQMRNLTSSLMGQKRYDTIHLHTGEQRAGESVESCFRKSKYNSIGGKRAQSGQAQRPTAAHSEERKCPWFLLSHRGGLSSLQQVKRNGFLNFDSCDLEKLSRFLKNPLTVC